MFDQKKVPKWAQKIDARPPPFLNFFGYRPLGAFWLILGSLWAPFGARLPPLALLLAPLWLQLGSLGALFAPHLDFFWGHFGGLVAPVGVLWAVFGCILASLVSFWELLVRFSTFFFAILQRRPKRKRIV